MLDALQPSIPDRTGLLICNKLTQGFFKHGIGFAKNIYDVPILHEFQNYSCHQQIRDPNADLTGDRE